jgi:hypothetical protein
MPIRNVGTLLENLVVTEAGLALLRKCCHDRAPFDFVNSFAMPPCSPWRPNRQDSGFDAATRFNTSKTDRWETSSDRCHINWVVLDIDWEAEFCRVAEAHPKVIAYTKNHNLGLEVPYRYGSETRKYLPDFIVQVGDGHGHNDPLNLVVEIKGYRREDAKERQCLPGLPHA